MKEKQIQTLLSKKINESLLPSMAYELKLSKGGTIPLKAFKEHQLDILFKVKNNRFHYKIPDMAAVSGYTSPKPFDGFLLVGIDAYVAICFYKPRQQKIVHFVEINKFLQAIKGRTSLKKQEIADLQSFSIILSS